MKPFLFICQLMITVTALGQSTGSQLQFKGYQIRLGIGKDGSLALATDDGEIGLAGSMTGGWRRADVSYEPYNGINIETPCFFNKDTGFVSGNINSEKNKYDIIYRTTDGGRNWKAVKFGQDGYADDAAYTDNGEAWLSVERSGIAYTTDYGLTWEKFKSPDVSKRFGYIYFNTSREGLIAAENLIYYTPNNCRSWKKLPTPLDQRKYNKTNRRRDPGFRRVAIYKNYFFAVQEDLVFYSKRDSVNWIYLPGYYDVYTDPNNSALFFRKKFDRYVRVDDNLKPVHTLEVTANDARCRNGNLYIISDKKIVQWLPDNDTVSTWFEKEEFAITPKEIGFNSAGSFGYRDNKIFVQKEPNGSWDSLFTLPVQLDEDPVLNLISDDTLLYQSRSDSLFYFDLSGRLQKQTSKDAMIAGFVKSGIKQLVFSKGSYGCFHEVWNKILYKNLGNEFGDTVVTSSRQKSKDMPENASRINAKIVSELISQLPALFKSTHMASLKGLGFTENDYKQCKADIQTFKASLSKKNYKENEDDFDFPRNNLDFNRLLNLVDTIKHIDAGRVYGFLINLRHIYGTTVNVKKIELVNNDNEVLSIYSNDSQNPHTFNFPWRIELNGCEVKSVDANIIRFIEKAYPAFLEDAPAKVKLLHEFVKWLY